MIPKALVEAALFLADRPLSVAELAQKLGLEEHVVLRALAQIAEELEEPERGLELGPEGGGYVLRVKRGLAEKVRPFAPHQDLSEPVLRTLAVIIAKAPVTQSEVVKLRGQRAYQHIRELISRGFVAAEEERGTKILTVTEDLLRYFGVPSRAALRSLLSPSGPVNPSVDEEGGVG